MKRIFIICLAASIALVAFNCKKEDRIVPREGLINFVTGDVTISSAQGAGQAAKIGDKVTEGTTIITKGANAMVDIYFGENAVKVLGNTSVEVKKLLLNATKESEQTELFVNNGALFSKVSKLSKSDDYRVKSPTATAGVRGTDFLLEESNGKANVSCLEGKVECNDNSRPSAPSVVLEQREEVDIQPGQDMVKKQISEDRLNMMNIRLTIDQMREDIRRQYLQQKEEMQKYLNEQRQRDREAVQQQRDADRQRVEDQTATDRANIDAIKGDSKARQDESTSAARAVMSQAKDTVNTGQTKSATQSQIDAVKSSSKPATQNPLEQFRKQQQQ